MSRILIGRVQLQRHVAFGGVLCALVLLQGCAGHAITGVSAADNSLLQRMLVAEDARGKGAKGIAPLLDGAKSADHQIRMLAVRSLGRLQQPRVMDAIGSLLGDSFVAVRSEAANALAQSVQGLPRGAAITASINDIVSSAQQLLAERLAIETDPEVVGVLARSIGRLPLPDSASARAAERSILAAVARVEGSTSTMGRLRGDASRNVVHGLYTIALKRRTVGNLSPAAKALLDAAATDTSDVRVQRMGLIGIPAAGYLDGAKVEVALLNRDDEARRLAFALRPTLGTERQGVVIHRALSDPSAGVRFDAVHALRAEFHQTDCLSMIAATHDASPLVALTAIDQLGDIFQPCQDRRDDRADSLHAIAATLDPRDLPRSAGHVSWHAAAHALVALARVPGGAPRTAVLLPRFLAHPRPQVREYAARAAVALKNADALLRLAADPDHNVRATAIAGLSQIGKHGHDSVYVAALASGGYQVVLAAATALAGSPQRGAVPALLASLDRLSAERRENSRDERRMILNRLAELGAPSNAPYIERYVTDFDSTVAAKAASMLTKWTGTTVVPRAKPLPLRPEPLAKIFRTSDLQLRITMAESSGGGTILVRLFSDETPATIARILRLAQAHYYDGLTFHRVVLSFVIQGGSPGANEQVGDAAFMRDELGMRSHDRGTLGISTRGRDTGDAQFFVNLVDNPRLDHDYTVFGEVISGMVVVDQILEGDVMARVEVIGGTIPK